MFQKDPENEVDRRYSPQKDPIFLNAVTRNIMGLPALTA